MKAAIPLSDSLYGKAEKTAQFLGISCNKLIGNALEESILRHNGDIVTQKINEVYDKVNPNEFYVGLDKGVESLSNLTKNDTW
ncbi:MAG: hypothetical protein FWH12_09700 [Treponema sp.]|nr:hypothetical protein [Treponema sp.]